MGSLFWTKEASEIDEDERRMVGLSSLSRDSEEGSALREREREIGMGKHEENNLHAFLLSSLLLRVQKLESFNFSF